MRLALNVDHFATLRQARKNREPDPVLAALLAEQAGAEGIVCHLRADRRHIQESDLANLRAVVKTKLNLEMAAAEAMMKIALRVNPDVVSLVPEQPDELTTQGGLNVTKNRDRLAKVIPQLRRAGIRISIFIDAGHEQIQAASDLGVDLIEINTGIYADLKPGKTRDKALKTVRSAAEFAAGLGLEVHAGHGLDYRNVLPIAAIPHISELSIGFSIIARAAIVGIERAVWEMIALLEK